jgi:hypothetical protein
MGKLDQLAGMEGGPGMGGEEEAAQMVMEGTKMLLQAAQMNPDLQPMVMEAVQSLKRGMERIIGPAGAEEEMGGQQPQKKRQKPPKSPPVEEDALGGGYGM